MKKGRTNDMGKYSTEQAAGAQGIETLGGGYALKWDDEAQMSVNAHAALLSQFAKAGGFLDRAGIVADDVGRFDGEAYCGNACGWNYACLVSFMRGGRARRGFAMICANRK